MHVCRPDQLHSRDMMWQPSTGRQGFPQTVPQWGNAASPQRPMAPYLPGSPAVPSAGLLHPGLQAGPMGALMPGFYPPAFFASHPGAPLPHQPLQYNMIWLFTSLEHHPVTRHVLLVSGPGAPPCLTPGHGLHSAHVVWLHICNPVHQQSSDVPGLGCPFPCLGSFWMSLHQGAAVRQSQHSCVPGLSLVLALAHCNIGKLSIRLNAGLVDDLVNGS